MLFKIKAFIEKIDAVAIELVQGKEAEKREKNPPIYQISFNKPCISIDNR